MLIVDLELEEMDASEIHAKRLNAKEVIVPKSGENWKFPVANGTVQPHGGDRRECREDFLDESERLSTNDTFSRLISRWVKHSMKTGPISGDFWYRHHVEPTVKLYTPREESFLILTSPESLILPWMCYRNAVSIIVGTSMDQEICPIHGKISDKSPYWRKSL